MNDIKEKYAIITELLEERKLGEIITQGNCEDNGLHETYLSFYYTDNALVYINYSFSQGHSNYNYHYYIWDNRLIFYFLEHTSWTWDYECTPRDQGFTNEIWTYDEHRVYFNNETPIKCLFKTYDERSVDQPYEGKETLSSTIKNQELDCDKSVMATIIKNYHLLLENQKNTTQNICDIDFN
ncbi:hypothetical protein U6A24_19020 [Aquimarina gracilis]|uniref:DUF402 domain-containing protein n=1 Tax=Aquimarina gracilis TaxID=874422 RepID=A0ABU6A0D8_9FLAO|nr:hypothetical protein [Aquimarina gracilis]MEB3347576.1 hypothetical protein [Aquimarina gracilis]